jgi:hypothetical protein
MFLEQLYIFACNSRGRNDIDVYIVYYADNKTLKSGNIGKNFDLLIRRSFRLKL